MSDLGLTRDQALFTIGLATQFQQRLSPRGPFIAAARTISNDAIQAAMIAGIINVLVAKGVCTEAEVQEYIRLRLNDVVSVYELLFGIALHPPAFGRCFPNPQQLSRTPAFDFPNLLETTLA